MSERYTIELRALPGGEVPVVVRLRHLLKQALRQHGFRCLSCVQAEVVSPVAKDGTPASLAELAAALAERSADLAGLLAGANLPGDVADDLRRRLGGLVEEVVEVGEVAAEAGP